MSLSRTGANTEEPSDPPQQAIPAYYINLDQQPQRREHMCSLAARFGIAITRIPAVDGRQLPPEALERHRQVGGRHGPPPPPAIGCFLSHRKAWEAIAAGSARYAAVFEDDVLGACELQPLFGDTAWIPSGADILKLETKFRPVRAVGRRYAALGPHYSVLLSSAHTGTGAYLLSRAAARRLLERPAQLREEFDRLLFDPSSPDHFGLSSWQLIPAVCAQEAVLPRWLRSRLQSLGSEGQSGIAAGRKPSRSATRSAAPRAAHLVLREGRRLLRQAWGLALAGWALLTRRGFSGKVPLRLDEDARPQPRI